MQFACYITSIKGQAADPSLFFPPQRLLPPRIVYTLLVDTKRTRRHRMTLRLSDAEYQQVHDLAEEWGVLLSGAIRRLIHESRANTPGRPNILGR